MCVAAAWCSVISIFNIPAVLKSFYVMVKRCFLSPSQHTHDHSTAYINPYLVACVQNNLIVYVCSVEECIHVFSYKPKHAYTSIYIYIYKYDVFVDLKYIASLPNV